ncbi:MAG: tetratricopeptide repeat protein, partial [Saprospiraceae bacterium]
EKAISIKHDYHEAFYNMGNTYNELNEYSESIKCYEKAISIKPDKHEAFYNMGNAYDELQEYSESIKSYEKAISIKHDYHEAFYNMGLAYRKLNEYSESIKCYEKAISIKHDYHEAFNNMGFAYDELQEYLESIKCYEKAIAIKHDYSSPYINLGFTLFKTGNFPKAENILKQGIELGSIDLNNMNLGHVYLTQDKETAALVCYVKAYNAFDNKEQYWEGMEDDFQYLEHHGVSKAYYRGILEKIKSRVE